MRTVGLKDQTDLAVWLATQAEITSGSESASYRGATLVAEQTRGRASIRRIRVFPKQSKHETLSFPASIGLDRGAELVEDEANYYVRP